MKDEYIIINILNIFNIFNTIFSIYLNIVAKIDQSEEVIAYYPIEAINPIINSENGFSKTIIGIRHSF